MSATVHHISPAGALLTKKQLALHLGRSTRWIELRVNEGMPSVDPTERFPHRRFRLGDVEAWLAAGAPRRAPLSPPVVDRLAHLEREVDRLAAIVEKLSRREWRS